jgi:hypothetical protein
MPTPIFIYQNSRFFENLLEHRLLFDLARHFALHSPPRLLNVMRSEIDAFGVDLVLSMSGVTCQIQMKTRSGKPSPSPYDISESLWRTPNAFVLWMLYDARSLEPTSYYLLGGPFPRMEDFRPGKRPGFRQVKMQKANHRHVDLPQVASILFPGHTEQHAPVGVNRLIE